MPFVIVALTLFASLLAADAQVGAAASDVPESVRVERVLTAGQIDSSTVDVGALAVVVYGQGERHPISGAWTQLDTVRGSIKAVDSRRLIVGLEPDGWSKWIALERIQTLRLIGAPFSGSADRDLTRTRTSKPAQPAQAEPEVARSDSLSEQMEAMVKRYYMKADNRDALRIAQKLIAGGLGGVVGGLAGAAIALDTATWPEGGDGIGAEVVAVMGFCIGNVIGTPLGVSVVDSHDLFIASLVGSVVGLTGGIGLTIASSGVLFPSLFIGPVIGATMMSEQSRKPPQVRRVSLSLSPTLNGGLSAVATLRF